MKGTSPSRGAHIEVESGIEVPRWEAFVSIHHLRKGKSMSIVFVGIDLAKNVFAVHGVDEHGKPALVRPSVPRAKLHELIATLPPCTVAMESCSGAHHWARLFAAHGHTVRLIAPKFDTPYR
jgi:transposase